MSDIKSKIESLLFISAKPMSVNQLASLLKKKPADLKVAGDELVENYKNSKGGIQIIKNGTKYQMVSSPDNANAVQEYIKDETTGELSRPSLEALTIIAYRGPISKIDLDRIRGVNCSLIVRNLLLRGLIEARADKVKKETYYNVTFDFIRFLGINDIKELPEYEKLNMDDTIDRVLEGIDKENNDKNNNDAVPDKKDNNKEEVQDKTEEKEVSANEQKNSIDDTRDKSEADTEGAKDDDSPSDDVGSEDNEDHSDEENRKDDNDGGNEPEDMSVKKETLAEEDKEDFKSDPSK